MFEGHNQAIGELIAIKRLVDSVVLREVVDACAATGHALAPELIARQLVDRETLLGMVAEHLGCEAVPVLPDALPAELIAQVDAGLARSLRIVPYRAESGSLTVAPVDPLVDHLVENLSFALGRAVRIVVSDPVDVLGLLQRYYGLDSRGVDGPVMPAAAVAASVDPAALSENDLEKMAGQPPIVRFVSLVLTQAVRERASDVHFEPFEHEFRIRCRVDGALRDLPTAPKAIALPVVSRLKVLANLNIAERRLPQDGRIRLSAGGRTVDLRVSTLPTQFGESVVLRILDQSAVQLELGQLGLPENIQHGLEAAIQRPHGIVIVTGPTGSGKTTTLYSCLQRLNLPGLKLLTVEDPVEYEIDGIMQVPVNPAAGLDFSRALRTFLRHDPDIVMVGEIRDAETARIAIQAALTGHLVLTTLHTNDAASAVTRLLDMGIEPFLLASTVEAVLAQRLLRRVCARCRTEYEPDETELRPLQPLTLPGPRSTFWRGRGCPDCQRSGYRGRLGLFELLVMNEAMRESVARGDSLTEIRRIARGSGLVSLREAGCAAMRSGDTTIEEVLKHT